MENKVPLLNQQISQDSSEDEKQRQKALGFMKQISYSLHEDLRANSKSNQTCNAPRSNIKEETLFQLIDSFNHGIAPEVNNTYPIRYACQTNIKQQTVVQNSNSRNHSESLMPELVDFILEMEQPGAAPQQSLVSEQEQINRIRLDLMNNVHEMHWRNGQSQLLHGSYQTNFQMRGNCMGKTTRRPRNGYHCPSCDVWFTTAGLLKRHFMSQGHKNRIEFEGGVDPRTMAMWNFQYSRNLVHPYARN